MASGLITVSSVPSLTWPGFPHKPFAHDVRVLTEEEERRFLSSLTTTDAPTDGLSVETNKLSLKEV